MCDANVLCINVKNAWAEHSDVLDVNHLTEIGHAAAQAHGEGGATLYNTIAIFAEQEANRRFLAKAKQRADQLAATLPNGSPAQKVESILATLQQELPLTGMTGGYKQLFQHVAGLAA